MHFAPGEITYWPGDAVGQGLAPVVAENSESDEVKLVIVTGPDAVLETLTVRLLVRVRPIGGSVRTGLKVMDVGAIFKVGVVCDEATSAYASIAAKATTEPLIAVRNRDTITSNPSLTRSGGRLYVSGL
jgi:hypothetical protein